MALGGVMITPNINGKPQRFDGDPEMPLLWVLRDELNLKGTNARSWVAAK